MSESTVQRNSDALYNATLGHGQGHLFSQEELEGLNAFKPMDRQLLTDCINQLAGEGLLKLMTVGGKPYWRVVSKEDAEKYRNLTQEESIVLSYIEEAGRDGIWTRIIRSKSNLSQIPLNKALKSLEYKTLINQTRSARFPNRKLYILSTLQPSEDVSGGPFYTDGVLDEEYVRYASLWLEGEILRRSWRKITVKSHKRKKPNPGAESSRASDESSKAGERVEYLHWPPGYLGYPTVGELARGLNEVGISTLKLKEAEVEQLLNLLRWDGKIERVMGAPAYKSSRRPESHPADTTHELAETPCGRCPVSDLCDDTGPINATTCEYFPKWFDL